MRLQKGIGSAIFLASAALLNAQVQTGEVPTQPEQLRPIELPQADPSAPVQIVTPSTPKGIPPIGGGSARPVPKATSGRIPMISASGRTPAEIEAATKPRAIPKGAGANLPVSSENAVAKLPYQELIKIAQSDTSQAKDAQMYFLKIGSALEGVKPGDIKLVLEIPDLPMELPVTVDGFFQVPYSIDLYEKNPLLVANQPRGSLSISVKLALPEVEPPKVIDGKVRYKELFRPVVEMAQGMSRVDPNFGKDGQQQFALEIQSGTEPILVKRALGSRTIRPNKEGKIYMVLERMLYDENPEIAVPAKITVNVRPVTAAEAAAIRAQ